jgi:putative ABC transport system permease protein
MYSSLVQLRLSTRALRRARLASGFIIATLALCIGATVGVFSIVNAVLFRGLPYHEPGRLVWLSSVRTDRPDAPFSLPEFMDLRERARAVDLAAYANWSATLRTASVTQRLQGLRISAAAFGLLGAQPSAGRLLRASDDAVDAPRVVLLAYGFWEQNYRGRADAVGATIRLNGDPYTIVGVLPRHFPLPLRDFDVIAPLVPDRDPRRHVRGSVNFLRVFGRLRDGATPEAAERELTAATADLRASFPTEYATKLGVRVTPMQRYIVADSRLTLLVLLACVGLMLAIGFANVLNLLLIRSTARQGEIAVRRALGASPRHVAGQLLAEGALLATAGAVIGTLVAYWGVALVVATGPATIPRLDEARVDGMVLLCVAALLAFAIGVFSLAPLGVALRATPQSALRAAGRTGAGQRGQGKLRGAFIVSQVALAVILSATTVSLLRSLRSLERVELGYRPDSVFVARLSLPAQSYARSADVTRFYERLHTALERQPGALVSGVVSVAPLSGLLAAVPFTVPSGLPVAYREQPAANFRAVSPGYLAAIRARIVAGRGLAESDDAAAPKVALVSRALADRYFGVTGPLGRQVLVDDNDEGPRPLTVVGVVENLRHVDLHSPPSYDIYIPLRQIHEDGVGFVTNNQFWTVRVGTSAAAFGPLFVQTLRAIDPEVATSEISSMSSYVDGALASRRFAVALLIGVSVIALVLAAVGVYGVMAYAVTQRRREIGVRLALGAPPRQVARLVLGQALSWSAVGCALGVTGSLLAGRAVSGLLFGVAPNDGWTLIAVSVLMGAISFAASWIPASRAARVDPVVVLSGA